LARQLKQRRNPVPRGFSLIELMIVVSVMSVLTFGIVLGFGGVQSLSPAERASDPARQAMAFEEVLQQASDLALFTRQPVGLHPLQNGWQVMHREAAGVWVAEPRLAAQLGRLRLDWQIGARPYRAPERANSARPPIAILGDGRSTPFTLRISPLQGSGAAQVCRSTAAQRLRCDPS